MKRWCRPPSASLLEGDLLQTVPALQPEQGKPVSYPHPFLFHALPLSGFIGIKLIHSIAGLNAQTCHRAFPEQITPDKCVSVLLCYQVNGIRFQHRLSNTECKILSACVVWSDSRAKGVLPLSPHTAAVLPLAWGYLAFCNTMRLTQSSHS